MAETFYSFVEGGNAGNDANIAQPTTSARIAVYDDMSMVPRVVTVEPSDIRTYLDEITQTVYNLASQQCNEWSFMLIRELVENFIHAAFIEPSISILDKGQTIVFSDQGPGIANKQASLKPGWSSATAGMKRYIRGVGSGLPIVEEQMKHKHGSITIEDNLGRGTIVTVSLVQKEPLTCDDGCNGVTGDQHAPGQHAWPGQTMAPAGQYGNPAYVGAQGGNIGAPQYQYQQQYPYQQGMPQATYYQQPPTAAYPPQSYNAYGYQQPVAAQAPYGGQNPWQGAGQPGAYPSGAPQGQPYGAYPGQPFAPHSGQPQQPQQVAQPYGMAPQNPYGWPQAGYPATRENTGYTEPVHEPSRNLAAEPAGVDAHVPLDTEQRAILLLFPTAGSVGPTTIENALGISKASGSRKLQKLAEAGYVTKKGQKYVLTGEGEHVLAFLKTSKE